MRELYEQAFADLGERLEDHLELCRIDPTYHIYFGDGSKLALSGDLEMMRTQLEAIEPGSFDAYLRYLGEGSEHYRLALPKVVKRNFRNLMEFANPSNLLLVPKIKVLKKHYSHIGSYFRDPRLKAAFTFQDMYMGLSPTEASAMFSMLQYSELVDGVWFPLGGMHRVIETLVQIAQTSGVRFEYGTPVSRINVSGNRVTGVTVEGGDQVHSNVVVANADLPYVYRKLLPDRRAADRLERKKFGFSAIVFYWGLDRQYPILEPHNLFLTPDFPGCLDSIFKDFDLPKNPPLYVHVPSRVDPSLAPEGCDSIMAAVPVGNIDHGAGQDWTAISRLARDHVLQRLAKIGASEFEKHIQAELCHGPTDWERQINLVNGSTHGLSHTLTQLAYLRPSNRHAHYKNLYFTGASTHPGTGMPSVLVSARLAVERVLEDAQVTQRSSSALPAIAS
jgi:phytoene desaturase